jgi:hypothetical protein
MWIKQITILQGAILCHPHTMIDEDLGNAILDDSWTIKVGKDLIVSVEIVKPLLHRKCRMEVTHNLGITNCVKQFNIHRREVKSVKQTKKGR